MPSWWIHALLVSSGIYAIAFLLLRKALPWWQAALVACIFFPSQLFYVISGANSLVYLTDLACPFLVAWAWMVWPKSPAKIPALLMLLSIGGIPMLSELWGGDRMGMTLGAINLWRSIAVACLFIAGSTMRPAKHPKLAAQLGLALWMMNAVISVCVLLQLQGVFNTNVYMNIFMAGSGHEENLEYRYINVTVLGFYRSTQGLMAMFGCLLATYQLSRKFGWVPLLGWMVSFYAATLIGSKTSLICILVAPVLAWLTRTRYRLPTLIWGSFAIPLAAMFILSNSTSLTDQLYGYLDTVGASKETVSNLSGRDRIWTEALIGLDEDPSLALGKPSSKLGYLMLEHNEFLNVFCFGGILNLALYVSVLGYLFLHLFKRHRASYSLGFLAFVAMVIQSMTVGHLQPLILMVNISSLCALLYGLDLTGEPTSGSIQ